MSIEIHIKDPKSSRLAKLIAAVAEYMKSTDQPVNIGFDLNFLKKEDSE